MTVPIVAAKEWATNAELIADVAQLWLNKSMKTVDVTYGQGVWWKKWAPEWLIPHDIRWDGVDYRDLPEPNASVDLVAFDPPYISKGGRSTSGIKTFDDRYGLEEALQTPLSLHSYNMEGLAECVRILRKGGVLLTKCMDYISSGRYHPVVSWTIDYAGAHNMRLEDSFIHLSGLGPQPGGRQQVHARRNHSTLLVFRKR